MALTESSAVLAPHLMLPPLLLLLLCLFHFPHLLHELPPLMSMLTSLRWQLCAWLVMLLARWPLLSLSLL